MHKTITRAVALLLAAVCLTGCNQQLKEEKQALLEENESLRGELAQRNAALDDASYELRDRDIELAQLRSETSNVQRGPNNQGGFDQIPGVRGVVGAGEVTAIVESDILFESGKTTLKSAAKTALNSVASVLKSTYPGRDIRITGHTDSDPIKKSGHESNHHLGFKRAYAVREYLASRGIDAKRMQLASYGPDRPAGSKASSRRVEISVIVN